MQRRHLFEWNDQPWLPKSLRDTLTDYLQFVIQHAATYAPVVSLLRRAIAESGTHQIVDLCSGGAGPWPSIYAELTDISSIVLTDKFPNHVAFTNAQAISGGAIHFAAESVDATAVPQNRTGLRTLFSSFHHFHPTDARAILQDAVTKRQGIAIFEATHRSPLALSLMGIVPLMVLLVTPLIRPFRWSRLFWTYLIPVAPFLILFDGIVSSLRTYTPTELRDLTANLAPSYSYHWETGEQRAAHSPIPITYLIGYPLVSHPSDPLPVPPLSP